MTSWVRLPFISEKEDAHRWPDGQWDDAADDDCVPTSGLGQYLGAKPGKAPATHFEAERIRQDAGVAPTGPMSSDDLIRGTTKRYGWAATKIAAGFTALRAALVPGTSATVSGKPSNFPTGHRLRRFLPTFTAGHRVLVGNYGDYLWWIDPEGTPVDTYRGEKVTWAEIQTFVAGGSSHTVAAMAEATEPMVTISDRAPKSLDWQAGVQFYDLNGAPYKVAAAGRSDRASDFEAAIGGAAFRSTVITDSQLAQDVLVLLKVGDPKLVVKAVPAPPPPDCTAAVDAATAPLLAKISTAKEALG